MVAVSLGAALIGSAVIGGVSAVASANSSKNAINKATDASTQAAREANALAEKTRNENLALNRPGYDTGIAAMGQINALLGLPQPTQTTSPYSQPPNALAGFAGQGPTYDGMGYTGEPTYARNINGDFTDPAMGYGAMAGQPAPQPMQDQGTIKANALAAYDRFKEYGGYTTRLAEGNRAINTGYAARGAFQSGAAQKALAKYNQDYASGEFGNYMGYLGGQQNLYTSAANALSGTNSAYANIVSSNNRDAANTVANGALAKANVNNQMYGSLANAAGGIFGGLSSSYGFNGGILANKAKF